MKKKSTILVFLLCILFTSCQKDDQFEESVNSSESLDSETPSSMPDKFKFDQEGQIINSNFYKFYNVQKQRKTSASSIDGSIIDSLIIEKTIVYQKKDTTFYTIPYKAFTDEYFHNLFIVETNDSFIPFKIKYFKGNEYPENPHDLGMVIENFYFNGYNENTINTKSSCITYSFNVAVPCTGSSHHLPGDTCPCGETVNCEKAYVRTMYSQVCVESTIAPPIPTYPGNSIPHPGGWGGPATPPQPGDPGTTPNDPQFPGGGFGCIAGYDCAGDPYQDQQLYNDCRYIQGGANCWSICGSANCTMEDNARFDLYQKVDASVEEITGLTDEQVTIINNYIGNGNDNDKNTFAELAISALLNSGEVDFTLETAIFLTGQDKLVYEKLRNTNGDLFQRTIGVFENNDNYCLSIDYGICETDGEGCTDGSLIEEGIVNIKIQDVENSSLDLAATILHESIHAEIYKYVYEHDNNIDPSNRENLLRYYFHFKTFEDSQFSVGNAQHQHMADNYVKPIAKAIRELDNYRYPLDYYLGFAWDGLRKYGWDGYWDNGVWRTLERNDPYQGYKDMILNTTNFPNN